MEKQYGSPPFKWKTEPFMISVFSMGGDGADGSLEQASVVDPLQVTLDKDGQHNARMKRMQIYANPKGINSPGFQLYTNLALVWVPSQIM